MRITQLARLVATTATLAAAAAALAVLHGAAPAAALHPNYTQTKALPQVGVTFCNASGGAGWRARSHISDDDGMVLQSVGLGPRLLARDISVPYLEVKRDGEKTYERLELLASGETRGWDSRLVEATCRATAEQLEISATYTLTEVSSGLELRIEQLFVGKAPVLRQCDAFEKGDCSQFWPSVTWGSNDPRASDIDLRIPQRFNFDIDALGRNAADFFDDNLEVRVGAGLAKPLSVGRASTNKRRLEVEYQQKVVHDGGVPFEANKNFHLGNRQAVEDPEKKLVSGDPGCPECAHAHWKWPNYSDGPRNRSFTDGSLNLRRETQQEASTAVVLWKPNEQEPANWRDLITLRKTRLVESTYGTEKIPEVALVSYWWEGEYAGDERVKQSVGAHGIGPSGVILRGKNYLYGDGSWPYQPQRLPGNNGAMFFVPAMQYAAGVGGWTDGWNVLSQQDESKSNLLVSVSKGGDKVEGPFWLSFDPDVPLAPSPDLLVTGGRQYVRVAYPDGQAKREFAPKGKKADRIDLRIPLQRPVLGRPAILLHGTPDQSETYRLPPIVERATGESILFTELPSDVVLAPLPDGGVAVPPAPLPVCAAACATTWGDPHLSTFDGAFFDYQKVGEFVLTRDTRDGFQVQVRQQPFGTSRRVSVNTAAAFAVGEHRVTVSSGDGPVLRVDGQSVPFPTAPLELSGGGRVSYDASTRQLRVFWPDGTFAVATVRDVLDLSLGISHERLGHLEGLLGDADGSPQDDLVDGAPAGGDWRIDDATSLFDYAPGESTATFTDAGFPYSRLRASDLPDDVRASAEATCRAAGVIDAQMLDACVLDLAVTGDLAAVTAAAGANAFVAQRESLDAWDAAADFPLGAGAAVPASDQYGNTGVWSYEQGSAQTDAYLPGGQGTFGNCGELTGWRAESGYPFVAISRAKTGDPCAQLSPAGSLIVHPRSNVYAEALAADVVWTSPVTGRVTVSSAVADADHGGGDGISWSLAAGDRTYRQERVPNAGESVRQDVTLEVSQGEQVRLSVEAASSDMDYDSTRVWFSVNPTTADAPLSSPLGSAVTLEAYEGAVMADRPVAYWPLADSTGPVAVDRTGGTAGVVAGGARLGSAPGPVAGSTALTVDGGACSGVDVKTSSGRISPQVLSVEAWVRTTATDTSRVVFRRRTNGYRLSSGVATDFAGSVSSSSIADGKWHHVVGTTVAGGTSQLFIDGELVDQDSAGSLIYTAGEAAIGRDGDACNGVVPSWRGEIAHVAIFDRQLSPEVILTRHALLAD